MQKKYFNKVELDSKPRDVVLQEIKDEIGSPEMSEFESAFLCGLIKSKKPKKIVEIGVAEGGTTAIILECLKESFQDEIIEMYSLDYSQKCYCNPSKQTGYLAIKKIEETKNQIKHQFKLGDVAPRYLKEIGDEIDFIILDTLHVLPGEILDFLAILPLMSKNATVVLHDTSAHHITSSMQQICTQVLMDTVVAEKYIMEDPSRKGKIPNISAFQITDDTRKYIGNVFMSLTLPWDMLQSDSEMELYHKWYQTYYEEEFIKWYEHACEAYYTLRKQIESWPKRMRNIARIIYRGKSY